MERKLGISLYPEHSTKEQDMAYISAAARHGFSRIFTCLLSVNRPKEEIVAEFKEIIGSCKRVQYGSYFRCSSGCIRSTWY